MRDWKQGIPYDKTGDLFRYRVPNEIEIKFIETLLQEERERVVQEIMLDFAKEVGMKMDLSGTAELTYPEIVIFLQEYLMEKD